MPRPAGSAPCPTPSRASRPVTALFVTLAALATLLSTEAAPPPASAAESWETVGRLNLAETQGMTYVSQADPRWDTAKEWSGQTRALILRLDDGSEHRVVYRFRS